MNTYHEVQQIISKLQTSNPVYEEGIAPLGSWTKVQTIYDYVDSIAVSVEKAAHKMGLAVVIAIVDREGNLVYFKRMKDSLLISLDIAPAKAYTAVAFKMSTEDVGPLVDKSFKGIESMVNRPIVTFGGGIPLIVNHQIIGGLGVSGGTEEEDIAIARAGVLAL